MRGLDHEEVEAFLSMVADEFEALIREKNQLSDDVLKLRTQLRDYQHVEHTLRETLVSARQSVEESKANSQKEAEIILREADLKAVQIIEDAKEELMELRNEIRLLKSQKDSFIKRLRYLLDSQLQLIGTLEIDEAELGESHKLEKAKSRGQVSRLQSQLERDLQFKAEEELQERFAEHAHQEPKIVRATKGVEPVREPEFGSQDFESLEDDTRSSDTDIPEPDKEDHKISNQFII